VVNQSLAQLLGGQVLGRRIRYADERRGVDGVEPPWYEIVGVVGDFSNKMEPDLPAAKAYLPLGAGDIYPSRLLMRVAAGSPVALAPRVAEITTALDASLRLREVLSLDQLMREEQGGWRMAGWGLGALTLSVLFLAAAGIYAMMSFAVTQRRREIGIRTALGANPGRLLRSIFARALRQLGVGVLVGLLVAALLDWRTGGEFTGGLGVPLLGGVAAFMIAVALLAALGPARRGLRIQPTEALRQE
jgi:predicted lysophospholipase L1 biosynthesis ABC-type transport system permease subunit